MSHPQTDAGLSPEDLTLRNALLMWFRVYEVPFDAEAATVLYDAALPLYWEGHGEQHIADHLIQAYGGLLSTRINAPSSSARH